MLRFTLHRQGHDFQVCTGRHGTPDHGFRLVVPHRAGPGYRPILRGLCPSPGPAMGLLPALKNRVCTLAKR
jgi:hypothetical protein